MDKTKIAIEVFNKCATAYQDKFMDVDLYKDTLDLFCNYIAKPNSHILDIACGPGNITKYLSNKRSDFKILGIDLATNMIDLAKVNNPKAEFKVMDCRHIETINQKFDGVMCGFCLPYLSKEEAIKLIGDASGLLNDSGILYISTMEDDYSKSGFKSSSSGNETIYMHYHEAASLTAALKENNFKIIDLRRQDFSLHDGTKTTDLIIIAGK